jgi:hypothetical protein
VETDEILKMWANLWPKDGSGVWHVLGAQLRAIAGAPTHDSNGNAIDPDLWYEVSAKGTFPLPF